MELKRHPVAVSHKTGGAMPSKPLRSRQPTFQPEKNGTLNQNVKFSKKNYCSTP